MFHLRPVTTIAPCFALLLLLLLLFASFSILNEFVAWHAIKLILQRAKHGIKSNYYLSNFISIVAHCSSWNWLRQPPSAPMLLLVHVLMVHGRFTTSTAWWLCCLFVRSLHMLFAWKTLFFSLAPPQIETERMGQGKGVGGGCGQMQYTSQLRCVHCQMRKCSMFVCFFVRSFRCYKQICEKWNWVMCCQSTPV